MIPYRPRNPQNSIGNYLGPYIPSLKTLVAEFLSPQKCTLVVLQWVILSPKSVKCIHSATKLKTQMSQPGLRLRVFEEKAEAGDWLRGLQRNLALPNGGEFCLFLLLLLLLLFLLLLVLSFFLVSITTIIIIIHHYYYS